MSNRINIERGTTKELTVVLVDRTGAQLPLAKLVGATAELRVRVQPADVSNVIRLSTVDTPTSLAFQTAAAALDVSFAPGDTANLAVLVYFYQLEVTLADGEVLPVVPWDLFDVNLGGSAEPSPPSFANTVKITADYPLSDDMTYRTPGGSPIENAQVRVYRKSDYDAGNLATPVGVTTTNAGGKWTQPILVTTGYTYIARFEKPYEFGPDTREFTA
jgi:hypothetical protein